MMKIVKDTVKLVKKVIQFGDAAESDKDRVISAIKFYATCAVAFDGAKKFALNTWLILTSDIIPSLMPFLDSTFQIVASNVQSPIMPSIPLDPATITSVITSIINAL